MVKMHPLDRRVTATNKTLARFEGRPFKWGSVDCAKVAAFHMRQFGHKPPPASSLRYRSAILARKCLKDLGCETLPEMIDQMGLVPKVPAAAIVGDIVSFPADDPLGAVGIVIGNGNMFAFHENYDVPIKMSMAQIDKAWAII